MRLFVAIELPEDERAALEALQHDLTVGRKTDPETMHLTLAFLGERDEDEAEEVDLNLEAVRAAPFDMRLSGLDTFGGAQPAVLFAGVAAPDPVTALHQKVRRRIRAAGIELDRERFRPHVTLARFRKRMTPSELEALRLFMARNAGFAGETFEVRAFTLFRSELTQSGAVHTPLASYPLGPC